MTLHCTHDTLETTLSRFNVYKPINLFTLLVRMLPGPTENIVLRFIIPQQVDTWNLVHGILVWSVSSPVVDVKKSH